MLFAVIVEMFQALDHIIIISFDHWTLIV